ncbi:MAG TPA: AbrB/MazE/SpoVT family DNA-binding domain-containing protein [archaeon]|nr:AbrB/MazE/SpoVT family DNA-binding domain-containing protein [archaeon]
MQMKRTIGEKGQVVLPKDIRDYAGIRPGSEVIFEIRGREIIIKPQKSEKDFLEDFLNLPKLKRPLKIKDIKKTIEEEYDLR